MSKQKWYDNWEAGWRADKQGRRVFYFKLPNARSDCCLIEFREGDHNYKKMEALHNFAESALSELKKK